MQVVDGACAQVIAHGGEYDAIPEPGSSLGEDRAVTSGRLPGLQ
jgi:hypothetical protein